MLNTIENIYVADTVEEFFEFLYNVAAQFGEPKWEPKIDVEDLPDGSLNIAIEF